MHQAKVIIGQLCCQCSKHWQSTSMSAQHFTSSTKRCFVNSSELPPSGFLLINREIFIDYNCTQQPHHNPNLILFLKEKIETICKKLNPSPPILHRCQPLQSFSKANCCSSFCQCFVLSPFRKIKSFQAQEGVWLPVYHTDPLYQHWLGKQHETFFSIVNKGTTREGTGPLQMGQD